MGEDHMTYPSATICPSFDSSYVQKSKNLTELYLDGLIKAEEFVSAVEQNFGGKR